MERPPAQYRYETDPMFRILVDTIHVALVRADYTASEIREAAMLAAIHFESTRIRSHVFPISSENIK